MAQRVDRWVAEDGTEFKTEAEADGHSIKWVATQALFALFGRIAVEDDVISVPDRHVTSVAEVLVSYSEEIIEILAPLAPNSRALTLLTHKVDKQSATDALSLMLPIAVDPNDKGSEWIYNNVERIIGACYRPPHEDSVGPVAYFDNEGNLKGRVSDEQLEVLCRNALFAIRARNGAVNQQERRELEAIGEEVRTTGTKTVMWNGQSYTVPDWACYIGEDKRGRVYVWSEPPLIDKKEGKFVIQKGASAMIVQLDIEYPGIDPEFIHIDEAA